MGHGFKHGGGGGTPLNFNVVGNPQPTNPKVNTIWLNTDVPITSWHFITTEPSNIETGTVWFTIGTSSQGEFNALKKNGIQVYPVSARQYIDGKWEAVTAMTFDGSEWKPWHYYIWDNGSKDISFSQSGSVCPFTQSSTAISWSYPKYLDGKTYFYTSQKTDITLYNKIKVAFAITGGHDTVSDRKLTLYVGTAATSVAASIVGKQGDALLTLDISNLSGFYHIGLIAEYSKGNATKWWLE